MNCSPTSLMLGRACGYEEVADKLEREVSFDSIMGGGTACLEELGVDRLCVHTRGFAMSFIRGKKFSGEDEVNALMFGGDVAAVFADTGQVKNERGIHEHVNNLPISKKFLV